MAWGILFIAGLCEIAWAVGLKYSQGFTKFGASAFTIVFMLLSFWLLGIALRTLPLFRHRLWRLGWHWRNRHGNRQYLLVQ